jgi:hypothetical protein
MENKLYRLAYWPIIDNYNDLIELYFKMVWMSFPHIGQIESIAFLLTEDLLNILSIKETHDFPKYFSPDILKVPETVFEKIVFISINDKEKVSKYIHKSHKILNWDNKSFNRNINDYNIKNEDIINVDKHNVTHDTWAYHNYFTQIDNCYNEIIHKSQQTFMKMKNEIRAKNIDNAYVFGSGPSATKAFELDIKDSFTIVSNGIVLNRELMNYIQPQIITGIDPLYHSGPSLYAGNFRKALAEAIEKFNSYFVTRIEFYRWFADYFPKHISNNIIGIPVIPKDGIPPLTGKIEIDGGFNLFNGNGNVLTTSLLPLALSMVNDVNILGCDGRPPADIRENEKIKYFWKHEEKSTIENWEEITYKAAPYYFESRNFEDYTEKHNSYLAKIIKSANALGKIIRCPVPSYLPVLSDLYSNEISSTNK